MVPSPNHTCHQKPNPSRDTVILINGFILWTLLICWALFSLVRVPRERGLCEAGLPACQSADQATHLLQGRQTQWRHERCRVPYQRTFANKQFFSPTILCDVFLTRSTGGCTVQYCILCITSMHRFSTIRVGDFDSILQCCIGRDLSINLH